MAANPADNISLEIQASRGANYDAEVITNRAAGTLVVLTDLGAGFVGEAPPPTDSGFALKTNGDVSDAYVGLNFGLDATEVWITFGLALDSASLSYWIVNDFGPDFAYIQNTSGPVTMIVGANDNVSSLEWDFRAFDGIHYGSSITPTAGVWKTFECHTSQPSGNCELYINGSLVASGTDGSPHASTRYLYLGQIDPPTGGDSTLYFKNVKVGTTRGASNIFADDFSGDLSGWSDGVTGDCTIVADPFP